MTHPIRTAAASVAACALLVPAAASAQGGPGHGDVAGQGQGQVPARVKAKVKRVVKTLARVEDHASDGEDAAALASIAKLDKAVAAAQRVAVKRAGTDSGPASIGRVAWADDEVATTTADLLDGASEDLTTGLAGSLDAALDSRDALVAAVAGLEDQSDYSDVLDRIAEDSADEAEAFTEGATDDEVTEAGATALNAAAAQATATASAASALAGDDSSSDDDGTPTGDVAGDEDRGDCGPVGRGGRGSSGSDSGTSGTSGESGGNAQEGPSRRA